jgi:hypothetical protein
MTQRIFALTVALALVAGFAPMTFAGDAFSGEGEIVEMGCYKRQNATGEGHAACAQKCLGNGAAMGLLQADGEIVELTAGDDKAPYEALIALAGKQAKVEGTQSGDKVTVTAASAG